MIYILIVLVLMLLFSLYCTIRIASICSREEERLSNGDNRDMENNEKTRPCN